MAIYTLDQIVFDETDDGIQAQARILKDGAPLQSFSIEVKKTTNSNELAGIVADHARRIVIHDTLVATTFTNAAAILAAGSFEYNG